MAFFLALIIIGFVMSLMSKNMGPTTSKQCKGHDWTYKNQGTEYEYMVCTKCKMLPGSDLKEESEF